MKKEGKNGGKKFLNESKIRKNIVNNKNENKGLLF